MWSLGGLLTLDGVVVWVFQRRHGFSACRCGELMILWNKEREAFQLGVHDSPKIGENLKGDTKRFGGHKNYKKCCDRGSETRLRLIDVEVKRRLNDRIRGCTAGVGHAGSLGLATLKMDQDIVQCQWTCQVSAGERC